MSVSHRHFRLSVFRHFRHMFSHVFVHVSFHSSRIFRECVRFVCFSQCMILSVFGLGFGFDKFVVD